VRRKVLARDRHRCRAPGCGRTRFLEVHHLKPRRRGGTNDPANLIALCVACHTMWHERSTVPDGRPARKSETSRTFEERARDAGSGKWGVEEPVARASADRGVAAGGCA
jgi:5-methylcytosine-specific restriction endonuclease McrA